MRRQDFRHTLIFSSNANIYVFANILGGRQYFMILLDLVAANICVYFQYLCASIFGAIVLTLGLRLML